MKPHLIIDQIVRTGTTDLFGTKKGGITVLSRISRIVHLVPDYPAMTLLPIVSVMQLTYFLAIILSLSCGTIPSATTDRPFGLLGAFLPIIAMMLIMHYQGDRRIKAEVATEEGDTSQRVLLERSLGLSSWLSLGAVLLCLRTLGFASAITGNTLLKHSLALQSFFLLLPGTVLILFSVYTMERFEGARSNESLGYGACLRQCGGKFKFMTGTSLFPILMLLGMIDLTSLLPLNASYASALNLGLVLIFIALILPWVAGRFIETQPIGSEQLAWIQKITKATGLPNLEIAIWNTRGRTMNAAVIGFVSPFRKLIISDRLASELTQKQLSMVILHEAAHLKRKHLPLRMVSIIPIWGAAAAMAPWFEHSPWYAPTASLACIVSTLVTLRWVAHHTEYDADLEACRLAVEVSKTVDEVPSSRSEASRELCRALLMVTAHRSAAKKSTWMHPGVMARITTMRTGANLGTTTFIKPELSVS